jgi:CheY-like chemotaxis protein
MALVALRKTVLVAEDDDAMRELLEEALAQHGYEVVSLEDGFELGDYLELAQAGQGRVPDAIVTDVRMPGRTGLEALASFAVASRCPVVVISAFADAETRASAKRLGAAVVLEKPFEVEALTSALEKLLAPEGGVPAERARSRGT